MVLVDPQVTRSKRVCLAITSAFALHTPLLDRLSHVRDFRWRMKMITDGFMRASDAHLVLTGRLDLFNSCLVQRTTRRSVELDPIGFAADRFYRAIDCISYSCAANPDTTMGLALNLKAHKLLRKALEWYLDLQQDSVAKNAMSVYQIDCETIFREVFGKNPLGHRTVFLEVDVDLSPVTLDVTKLPPDRR
ncbi:hypothetical protein HY990_05805 [Candidatus Micrarchaeota archaeon]|nr:hypothetical protein [Candidatus Micrarchaeota archaeon]